MKKVVLVVLVMVAMVLVACGGGDELEGTWVSDGPTWRIESMVLEFKDGNMDFGMVGEVGFNADGVWVEEGEFIMRDDPIPYKIMENDKGGKYFSSSIFGKYEMHSFAVTNGKLRIEGFDYPFTKQ